MLRIGKFEIRKENVLYFWKKLSKDREVGVPLDWVFKYPKGFLRILFYRRIL